jgi:hypothetical protein
LQTFVVLFLFRKFALLHCFKTFGCCFL